MKRRLTIVIKLGTSSIVEETSHEPLLSSLSVVVETACALQKEGHKIIIVSSGAIGLALGHMSLPGRPKHLPEVQALAAIGQCKLMSLWDQLFMHRRQSIAQILLTRSDIADRTQYLNAQNTFTELLHMGIIPIVNENDTLSVSEIKFGDNDTLSAVTAAMVQADYLFLMTDVACLYDKNPRLHPDAAPIEVIENISDVRADVSSPGSAVGTGGMSTKIVAARLATSAGVTTVICKSSDPGNISKILLYCESQRIESGRPSFSHSPGNSPESARRVQVSTTSVPLVVDEQDFRKRAVISSSPGVSALTPSTLQKPVAIASTDSAQSQTQKDDPTIRETTPPLHTRFLPVRHPIRDRYFWILHGLTPHGTIYIDDGACAAIRKRAGLLPVGVLDCTGNFAQQECVRLVVRGSGESDARAVGHDDLGPGSARPETEDIGCTRSGTSTTGDVAGSGSGGDAASDRAGGDAGAAATAATAPDGERKGGKGFEIGRALVNYSSSEIRLIRGLRSSDILGALGYADGEYVALRENIAFF